MLFSLDLRKISFKVRFWIIETSWLFPGKVWVIKDNSFSYLFNDINIKSVYLFERNCVFCKTPTISSFKNCKFRGEKLVEKNAFFACCYKCRGINSNKFLFNFKKGPINLNLLQEFKLKKTKKIQLSAFKIFFYDMNKYDLI